MTNSDRYYRRCPKCMSFIGRGTEVHHCEAEAILKFCEWVQKGFHFKFCRYYETWDGTDETIGYDPVTKEDIEKLISEYFMEETTVKYVILDSDLCDGQHRHIVDFGTAKNIIGIMLEDMHCPNAEEVLSAFATWYGRATNGDEHHFKVASPSQVEDEEFMLEAREMTTAEFFAVPED